MKIGDKARKILFKIYPLGKFLKPFFYPELVKRGS